MKKRKSVPQSGITGIILANQWNEIGSITGVSLYTNQEEIYVIAHNKKISKLISLVQTKVRVEGKLEQDADGNKIVYVEKIQALKKDNER
jgi:hypothetical protein